MWPECICFSSFAPGSTNYLHSVGLKGLPRAFSTEAAPRQRVMSVAAHHNESLPGNTSGGGVNGGSWLWGHSVSHHYRLIRQESGPMVRGPQCLVSDQAADELQSQLQPVGQMKGQHQREDSEDSMTPHAVTLGEGMAEKDLANSLHSAQRLRTTTFAQQPAPVLS